MNYTERKNVTIFYHNVIYCVNIICLDFIIDLYGICNKTIILHSKLVMRIHKILLCVLNIKRITQTYISLLQKFNISINMGLCN